MIFHMLQVTVEIPYVLLQALLFSTITYPAINFYWSAYKVFWYFYTVFCTLLFYTYFGMLLVSLAPSYLVASVSASSSYAMLNLFSGFFIPGPVKPTLSLYANTWPIIIYEELKFIYLFIRVQLIRLSDMG
jgi:ABC-type multidrug transport system permease subunit